MESTFAHASYDPYFPVHPAAIAHPKVYKAVMEQLRVHGIPDFHAFRLGQIDTDIQTDGAEISASVIRLKVEFFRAISWVIESEGSVVQPDGTQMVYRDADGDIKGVDLSSLASYPFFIAVKEQVREGLQHIVYGTKLSPLVLTDDEKKYGYYAEETKSSEPSTEWAKCSGWYGSPRSERIIQLCRKAWVTSVDKISADKDAQYVDGIWGTIPWARLAIFGKLCR
jgi:hypothetical protein